MSSISRFLSNQSAWPTIILSTLALWLGGSLILDLIIMPSFYASGMMSQADFVTAGYILFWIFNRVEILCAALILTGLLVLRNTIPVDQTFMSKHSNGIAVLSATLLLGIALIYTYALSPEMSALGLQLNPFNPGSEVPAAMNQLHTGYWLLEMVKLSLGGVILLQLTHRESSQRFS